EPGYGPHGRRPIPPHTQGPYHNAPEPRPLPGPWPALRGRPRRTSQRLSHRLSGDSTTYVPDGSGVVSDQRLRVPADDRLQIVHPWTTQLRHFSRGPHERDLPQLRLAAQSRLG